MSEWLWAVITYYPDKFLDGCLESIPQEEDRIVINTNALNLSVAEGYNRAINYALYDNNYESVIIINDDVRVRPDTGKALHRILKTIAPTHKGLLTTAYNVNVFGDNKFQFLPAGTIIPGMFCFCLDKNLIDKVGWFDERFEGVYFEDTDILYRIHQAGYTTYAVAPVNHISSATLNLPEVQDRRQRYYEENSQKYIAKWGGLPGEELE